MTDEEFERICQLEIKAERLNCLQVLLDAFEATSPFALNSIDEARQKEELTYSSRFLMGISDLARYYAQDNP